MKKRQAKISSTSPAGREEGGHNQPLSGPSCGLSEDQKNWQEDADADRAGRGGGSWWSRYSTGAKLLLVAVLIAVLGWVPAQRLMTPTSAEAIVNARIITVRAPIEGRVSMAMGNIEIGTPVKAGQKIIEIENARSDRMHLNNLRRVRDQYRTSLSVLDAKRKVLERRRSLLSRQQSSFRKGRIQQLKKRLGELDFQISAQRARHKAARRALKRAEGLSRRRIITMSRLDQARRDEHVAATRIEGLRERRKGIEVELNAAQMGTYVGDSYNDTPQSAQRALEVVLEIADLDARISGTRQELEAAERDYADEIRRQEAMAKAVMTAGASGRVWEVLTAPGEYVNRGQELMRLLDCEHSLVSASVSETVYQGLWIGQRAIFKPRSGGADLEGRVVGMNGLAAVVSNSAIKQRELSREPYHVTLRFPELNNRFSCQVGRSGLVKFDGDRAKFAANLAPSGQVR